MSNRFINTYIIPLDFLSLSLYQHNFDMTRMEIKDSFLCMFQILPNKFTWSKDVHSINAKNKLYYTCPIVHINNHFHASLTDEYPQREIITSKLGTCVIINNYTNM